MRVAIVHDYLVQMGGAERVVEALHHIYPEAPIYTSAYAPETMPDSFRRMDIQTSFMQRLPGIRRRFRQYLPLYPLAFRGLDLSRYDVVISSSSGWAHGVRTAPGQLHLCYCYTPARWLWEHDRYMARERMGILPRLALRPVIAGLRRWDLRASTHPDRYVGISAYVAERIRRVYGRSAPVIYPPVDTGRFRRAASSLQGGMDGYYLVVSRLNPYKRIDLAVRAFTELGLPLKVAGTGPDLPTLRRLAGPTVEFLGRVPDEDLPDLMARCQALVFPGEEDFGIVPVEAMAAGRPVIAYAAGGALETVVEGVTGVFFRQPTPDALGDAVRRCRDIRFDPAEIRRHAMRFDREVFVERFTDLVAQELAQRGREPFTPCATD